MSCSWQRLGAALLACTFAINAHAATYALDQFTLTSNGSPLFSDTFSDSVAPSAGPDFLAATPFPSGAESGGKLHLDPAQGIHFGGGQLQYAAPNHVLFNPVFTVTGSFDYTTPQPGETYFVRLDDFGATGSDITIKSYTIGIDRMGTQTLATLASVDPISGAVSRLASTALSGSANQITLGFRGTADGTVYASYQFSNASQIDVGQLTPLSNHAVFFTAYGTFSAPVPEPHTVSMM